VPWLLLLQFPVVLYQNLFVARSRAEVIGGGPAWDSVVGTMGGDPDGGGASGALALVLCWGIATVLLLRRSGLISSWMVWCAGAAALGSMLLAEIKVVAVFLPLAILIANRQRVFRSVVSMTLWFTLSVAFVMAVLTTYNALFWKKNSDVTGLLDYVTQADLDPRFYNRLTGEVSRLGAIMLWSDNNLGRGDWVPTVVGHGPASAKTSTLFGRGNAAKRHPFNLTTSSLSTTLWELGLLGAAIWLAYLAYAGFRALKHANILRGAGDLEMSSIIDSSLVALVLVIAGVAYNSDAINHPGIQTLTALIVGLLIQHSRSHRATTIHSGPAQHATSAG
jgi:hypothetical protein